MGLRGGRARDRLLPIVLVAYAVALAAASLVPVSVSSGLGATAARRTVNNLLHIPAYGALAALLSSQLRTWMKGGAVHLAAFGLSLAYGGWMELAQHFVPGRACSTADFVLNATGSLLGVGAFWFVSVRRKRAPAGRRARYER